MSKEFNFFLALYSNLEKKLGIDGKNRFITFPSFPISLSKNELIFDGRILNEELSLEDAGKAEVEAAKNREDFSRIANQVPQSLGRFILDGRTVSSVYRRLLKSELPLQTDNEDKLFEITTLFHNAHTTFIQHDFPSIRLGRPNYFPVAMSPPGEDIFWGEMQFDEEEAERIAPEASQPLKALLQDSGFLEKPFKSGFQVSALKVEIGVTQLLRPWFETDVVTSRGWRWNEEALSDGNDPPTGQLPAVVTGVVFARHMELELEMLPTAPRRFEPRRPSVGPDQPARRSGRASSISSTLDIDQPERPDFSESLELIRDSTVTPTVSLQDTASIAIKSPALPGETRLSSILFHIRESRKTLNFPVPVDFKIELLMNEFKKDLIDEKKKHKELFAKINELEKRLSNLSSGFSSIGRKFRLQMKIGGLKVRASALDEKIKIIQKDIDLLNNISQREDTEDDKVFILALVCSKIPKSPNPDPELFVI